MNDLTLTNNNLPSNIEDLSQYVLLNRQKLAVVEEEVKRIKRVDTAKGVYEQKLKEAQQIAEMVTLAEVQVGKLLLKMPKEQGKRTDLTSSPAGEEVKSELVQPKTKTEITKELGFTPKRVEQLQTMARHDEVVKKAIAEAKANDDIVSRSLVLNMIKQEQKEEKRAEKAQRKDFSNADVSKNNWKLYNIDIASLAKRDDLVKTESVDAIITDPPYPKEFLPLYEDLVLLAERVLKPSGVMVVMCGQSYLPSVMRTLTSSNNLQYHWTACYLTEGGQSPSLWQKKVNTFWKPLIIITKGEYKGDYIGDVIKTDVNSNDKRFHHWGQSENGMAKIVERITDPGQVVLDPFVGGGTTGVVAVSMGRMFIGADVARDCVNTTETRLKDECERKNWMA